MSEWVVDTNVYPRDHGFVREAQPRVLVSPWNVVAELGKRTDPLYAHRVAGHDGSPSARTRAESRRVRGAMATLQQRRILNIDEFDVSVLVPSKRDWSMVFTQRLTRPDVIDVDPATQIPRLAVSDHLILMTAIGRGCGLATDDRDLQVAAHRVAVDVLDSRGCVVDAPLKTPFTHPGVPAPHDQVRRRHRRPTGPKTIVLAKDTAKALLFRRRSLRPEVLELLDAGEVQLVIDTWVLASLAGFVHGTTREARGRAHRLQSMLNTGSIGVARDRIAPIRLAVPSRKDWVTLAIQRRTDGEQHILRAVDRRDDPAVSPHLSAVIAGRYATRREAWLLTDHEGARRAAEVNGVKVLRPR